MSGSKQIAKNTMFLYIRMLLTMGVTLYTSRVVLDVLGISDYGIYSVVGGIVAMFGFLNMAMASATQRFLSFEIGTKNINKLNKTFIAAVNIHLFIALFIALLAETIGLWFVNNKLNVDISRLNAVNWVYQFSVFATMVRIIQVPYNALIIAREKMNVYAVLSILEVLLKLGIVYLLVIILDFDKLKLYAVLIFVVTFLITMLYRFYCLREFSESKYRFFYEKQLYNELLSYSGWSLFGGLAAVARGQGSNILLNVFFGTVVNAAYGISSQVNSAVKQFVSNFQIALNPQIIKTYAENDFKRNHVLINQGAKLSFFLLFIIAFPIWVNIDFLIEFWLKNPPKYTTIFIRLALISLLLDSVSGPLMIGIQATGNIKYYQIVIGSVILLDMPITYFVLSKFQVPEYSYFVTISITLVSLFLRLLFLKKLIKFKILFFFKNVLFKLLLVSLSAFCFAYIYNIFIIIENKFLSFLSSSIFVFLTSLFSVVIIGFNTEERFFLKNILIKKLIKNN